MFDIMIAAGETPKTVLSTTDMYAGQVSCGFGV